MEPKALLTVRGQDGSFVSFFPDQQTRLTYGIDHLAEAPIIGKQWLSWSPDDDEHYRWAIAPARTYAPSLEVRRASQLPGSCLESMPVKMYCGMNESGALTCRLSQKC